MIIALVFSSFGPYHRARALALRQICATKGHRLVVAAMTAATLSHQWSPETDLEISVLCSSGSDGDVRLSEAFWAWTRFLRKHRPDVVVIAGYWPLSITLLSAVALARRTPRILMTESHAGTAKTRGLRTLAKRLILGSFSAALVGGKPQRDYLQSLGFSPARIRDGYDCVDNDLFKAQAAIVRAAPQEFQRKYGLPNDFFLTVARLVPKKNIEGLITAYAHYRNRIGQNAFHLVIVGDGELAGALR